MPALELDDGELLTENAVVLQYIADQAPGWHLIPPYGTMERYRVLEWLNYIATELHKGFAPLFHPTGEPRAHAMEALAAKFDYVEGISSASGPGWSATASASPTPISSSSSAGRESSISISRAGRG